MIDDWRSGDSLSGDVMKHLGAGDELAPRGSLEHNQTLGVHPKSGGTIHPALPLQLPDLYLEFCSSGDPRYIDIRKDHYVPHKGCHGQQIHFIIWYHDRVAGIISGASPVYASPPRDLFFKITNKNREKVLNGIIDNVVFRLIIHPRNLGSRVLALWEKVAAHLWKQLYGVKVFGFETFIVREGLMRERITEKAVREVILIPDPESHIRRGMLYTSANWSYLGTTSGSTKGHDGLGLTGGRPGGKGGFIRKDTPVKDAYGRWAPGYTAPVKSKYKSSWKAGTKDGTPREKQIAKRKQRMRQTFSNRRFFISNGTVVSL